MRMILAGLGAGLALGAEFVFQKGAATKGTPFMLLTFLLIGISLGLVASRNAIIAASLAAGGLFFVGCASIVIDTTRDPTSHNLWPFEVVLALGAGVLPTVFGFLLGFVVKRLVSLPPRASLVPAGCALLVGLLSPWFGVLLDRRDQDHAVRTLQELWNAERAYAAQHSAHRFTCQGPLLSGFEKRDWYGTQAKDEMTDRLHSYRFYLWCGPRSSGDNLTIWATPALDGPYTVYCISQAGTIHSGQYRQFDESCEHERAPTNQISQ